MYMYTSESYHDKALQEYVRLIDVHLILCQVRADQARHLPLLR